MCPVLGGAVLLWWAMSGAMGESDLGSASGRQDALPLKRRDPQNAVLVFGGTGKLGRILVKKVCVQPRRASRRIRMAVECRQSLQCCACESRTPCPPQYHTAVSAWLHPLGHD